MTDQWRPIAGYEGMYEVSDDGRVRGYRRVVGAANGKTKVIQPKPLTLTPLKSGHLSVEVHRGNIRKRFLVHRLVLEAFIGPCPDGFEGCHRNGVSSDNRIQNLYWGTRSDNMHDAVRHGTHHWARRTECERGHEFTPENTRPRRGGSGRECLACVQIWNEAKRAKREARAGAR